MAEVVFHAGEALLWDHAFALVRGAIAPERGLPQEILCLRRHTASAQVRAGFSPQGRILNLAQPAGGSIKVQLTAIPLSLPPPAALPNSAEIPPPAK